MNMFLETRKLILLTLLPLTVSAGNLPVEMITVRRTFRTAEEAAKAELEFLPLPEGKTVAFSCRWDDSSMKLLRMRKLMAKYGFRGTFYLHDTGNREFWKTVMPECCSGGCTLGNHTRRHKELPPLSPMEIHQELLGWRILLETRSKTHVSAFVLPYGKHSNPKYPNSAKIIGDCLKRAGLYGGADSYPMAWKIYGLPETEYFSTLIVRPGDKEPKEEKFDSDVQKHLSKQEKYVHLSLGIHVNHTEAGFATMEKCFAKYANRPGWWYCNENEYIAYQLMVKNAKVVKKDVDKNQAVFQIEVPRPEITGSDIPLWAKCGDEIFPLPHRTKMPQAIYFAIKDVYLTHPAPDVFRVHIRNIGSEMENVLLTLRLPPSFKEEVLYCPVEKINGEFTTEWKVTPVPAEKEDKALAALQLDFTKENIATRLWIRCNPSKLTTHKEKTK